MIDDACNQVICRPSVPPCGGVFLFPAAGLRAAGGVAHRLEGGGNGWRFGGHPQCRARLNVESRKRWMIWLNTPDPANDKMGKVVHLKPKPEQPA
jgi:hypothetical protein